MRRSARIARDLLVPAPPATAPVIQRACACGQPAGLTGRCAGCEGRERLAGQPKLTIGSPGDRFEREADRIADLVTGPASGPNGLPLLQRQDTGPAPGDAELQRMPQEDEEEVIQTKPRPGGTPGRPSMSFARHLASESHGGRALDRATAAQLEPQLGRDLSPVRLHTSPRAAALSRSINARAFTHKNHIFFGAGQYDTRSESGQHLLVHEIAHTMQQQPGLLRRKSVADLDKKIRKTLRISRLAPPASYVDARVKEYFDPSAGSSFGLSEPIEFSKTITEANEKKGLTSFAGKIISDSKPRTIPATEDQPKRVENADPAKWSLGPNRILDLELNLLPHGHDHAIYRFVRYNEGKTEKVLVVKTKVVASPKPAGAAKTGGTASGDAKKVDTKKSPATPQPAASPAPAPSFTGEIKIGNVTVKIDSSFGNDRGKIIADAIKLLPEPIRAKVDGLKIERGGSGKGPGGENGHYDEEKDTVKLWDAVFEKSHRRVGTASENAYQIVHELAHAVDLRPLWRAQNARDAARKRKSELQKDLRSAKFDLEGDPLFDDRTQEEKDKAAKKVKDIEAEIDKLTKEVSKQDKLHRKSKSVAGSELGKKTATLTTEFAKALKDDGVTAVKGAVKKNRDAAKKDPPDPAVDTLKGGITDYAQIDLREAFAENFSYYVLDEALLETLRPNTHKYFKKHFPKQSKGKAKP